MTTGGSGHVYRLAFALLAVPPLLGCSRIAGEPSRPAPVVAENPDIEGQIPVAVAVWDPASDDSAADEEVLHVLRELRFRSLGKGADHVQGVLPAPDPAAVAEAAWLTSGPRGGAASASGPNYDIEIESFAHRYPVRYYVDFFRRAARERFVIWLGRLNRYEGMVRAVFKARGIPEDLVYLGLIESGFSNSAVSRARAVGMWQFMRSTARGYGLQADIWVDERRDPFKATDAAARHLSDLNALFGSWYLAAAAYNGGVGRVTRGIRRLRQGADSLTDETFFDLSSRRYLRRETRDYVPKLIAAALIAKDPLAYGFDSIPYLQPLVFDEITVPDATGLDVLATLADTVTRALVELNPQYYRGVTPPGRRSVVRVPRGKGPEVARRYAELALSERVNFAEHRIRRGETLSLIAQRYRVSVSLITAANPGIRPRRLRIGHRLRIPVSRAARRSARVPRRSRAATGRTTARIPAAGYHTVRWGETLWIVAQRYGMTVGDLRRWNNQKVGDVLVAGTRLRVRRADSN